MVKKSAAIDNLVVASSLKGKLYLSTSIQGHIVVQETVYYRQKTGMILLCSICTMHTVKMYMYTIIKHTVPFLSFVTASVSPSLSQSKQVHKLQCTCEEYYNYVIKVNHYYIPCTKLTFVRLCMRIMSGRSPEANQPRRKRFYFSAKLRCTLYLIAR